MHVIQSQLVNYSYEGHTQKHIKLLRWWVMAQNETGEEIALPFNTEQEAVFFAFMEDHPGNFPEGKKEIFESSSLNAPILDDTDRDTDAEKPCLLLIRAKPTHESKGLCRRMDIILQNDELPVQLPFDLAGEIILEKV